MAALRPATAMWGKGSSKLDPAADGFVDSFYEQTPIDPAWDLEEKTEMIMDFITQQQVPEEAGPAVVPYVPRGG